MRQPTQRTHSIRESCFAVWDFCDPTGAWRWAYVAALGINAVAVAVPQVIRWIVDVGIAESQTNLIGQAVLVLLGLTLVKGVLGFLVGRWTESSSQHVAYDLRNAIHYRLSRLSFSYHDHAQT